MPPISVINFPKVAEAAKNDPSYGETIDLRTADFSGVRAITVQGRDKLLVCEIFRNIRGRNWEDFSNTPWIIIGKPELKPNGLLTMKEAVPLSPFQLANIYNATNYHPIDCFRGLYADVSRLAPHEKREITVPFSKVCEEFALSRIGWQNSYREVNAQDLLKIVLADKETRKRFQACAEHTAKNLRECIFTTYRNPEYYGTQHEFAHTMVGMGDMDSTNMRPHWLRLLKDSAVFTTIEMIDKYQVPNRDALEVLASKSEEVRKEFLKAQANELELFRENFRNFFPGAFKGSVLELDQGAGPGFYRFMVTHSHPLINAEGTIEPSTADLKSLLDLRMQHAVFGGEGFAPHERLVHRPVYVIIQPADWEGRSYFGLVLREKEGTTIGRELGVENDADLIQRFNAKGVKAALLELGIESSRFRH